MTAPRRLGDPRRIVVETAGEGRPVRVDGQPVEAVLESWLLEDRWWTDRPLRRRYWEVMTADGRARVLFHDLVEGGWAAQR